MRPIYPVEFQLKGIGLSAGGGPYEEVRQVFISSGTKHYFRILQNYRQSHHAGHYAGTISSGLFEQLPLSSATDLTSE